VIQKHSHNNHSEQRHWHGNVEIHTGIRSKATFKP
jgi:hypothetical protein